MPDKHMHVGMKVSDSPMGPGTITSFTERGFPRVDDIAVAWIEIETGERFDPYGVADKSKADREAGNVISE
jgi:hypothetical protein